MTKRLGREEILALANAATGGPWEADLINSNVYIKSPVGGYTFICESIGINQENNLKYIAAMHPGVTIELIRIIDELIEKNKSFRDALELATVTLEHYTHFVIGFKDGSTVDYASICLAKISELVDMSTVTTKGDAGQ